MIKFRCLKRFFSSGLFAILFLYMPVGVAASDVSVKDTSISKSSTARGSESKKSPPVGKNSGQGWILTLASDKFGLARYYLRDTTLRFESAMLVVFVDARTKEVQVGTWETKKCFTFPISKAESYSHLLGVSGPKSSSAFSREYRQSPWLQTRDLKVGEMDATEYERHVLNPPPGRTRKEFKIVGHLDCVSPKLMGCYHDLHLSTLVPGVNGMVLGDRVLITNPTKTWSEYYPKNAVRAKIPPDKLRFPDGFHKVNSASELFLDDTPEGGEKDDVRDGVRKAFGRLNGKNNPQH